MHPTSLAAAMALLMGTFILPVACGGGGTVAGCPGGPDCTCSDDITCTCKEGGGCGFDCQEESCKLACAANATCEGSCAGSCDVSCPEGSSCDIDIGQAGDFQCKDADCEIVAGDESDISCDGGTCTITCTARCDIACVGGATCQAKCAGDADWKTVEGSLQCQ